MQKTRNHSAFIMLHNGSLQIESREERFVIGLACLTHHRLTNRQSIGVRSHRLTRVDRCSQMVSGLFYLLKTRTRELLNIANSLSPCSFQGETGTPYP